VIAKQNGPAKLAEPFVHSDSIPATTGFAHAVARAVPWAPEGLTEFLNDVKKPWERGHLARS